MKKVMGLFKGYGNIPGITEYIFDTDLNLNDTSALFHRACDVLGGAKELDLYVEEPSTTMALLAVINYCAQADVTLTCYHYDRDNGGYYRQAVLHPEECPSCNRPQGNGRFCQYCGNAVIPYGVAKMMTTVQLPTD